MTWQSGLRTAIVTPEKPLSEEKDGCFLLIDLQGEALVGAERQHNHGGALKNTLLPLAALPAAADPLKHISLPGASAAPATTAAADAATAAPVVARKDGGSMLCFDVWGLIEWQRQQPTLQQPKKKVAAPPLAAAAAANPTIAGAGRAAEEAAAVSKGSATPKNAQQLNGGNPSPQSVSDLLSSSSKSDTSSSNSSRRPVLHVGSLVLEGQVEEATGSGGAGIAILRKVRRRLLMSRSSCPSVEASSAAAAGVSSAATASLHVAAAGSGVSARPAATAAAAAAGEVEEASQEVCCWEVQGIIRQKITFLARPALHPKKKLFADAAASLPAAQGPTAAPQPLQQQQRDRREEMREGHRHAVLSNEGERDSSRPVQTEDDIDFWLLGVSPLLLNRRGSSGGRGGAATAAAAAEDWLLMVVDEYLMHAFESGEALQLVGVPRLHPSPQQQPQQAEKQQQQQQEQQLQKQQSPGTTNRQASWPAWKGTLLCCKERAYLVQRNAIDGQLLIAYAPPVAAAAASSSAAALASPLLQLQTPRSIAQEEEQKDEDTKRQEPASEPPLEKQQQSVGSAAADEGRFRERSGTEGMAKVLGVSLVGVCSTVILLERAVGRTRQIEQILGSSSSSAAVSAGDSSSGDASSHQLRTAAGPPTATAVAAAAWFPRPVVSSSVLLQQVQASQSEAATHLLGGTHLSLLAVAPSSFSSASSLFPSLSSLLPPSVVFAFHPFPSAAASAAPSAVSEAPAAATNMSPQRQNREYGHPLDSKLRVWGQPLAAAADFSRSSFLLFIPQQRGYVLLSAAELLGFLQRLVKLLVFLPPCGSSTSSKRGSSSCSNSKQLTVGVILESLRESEARKYSLYPFTTRRVAAPSCSSSRNVRSTNSSSSRSSSSNKNPSQQTRLHATRGGAESLHAAGSTTRQGGASANREDEVYASPRAAEAAQETAAEEEDALMTEAAGDEGRGREEEEAHGGSGEGYVEGETEEEKQQQQQLRNLLPLDEGVLFQLLVKVCDLKSETSLPFPSHFVDMCPPLLLSDDKTSAAAAAGGGGAAPGSGRQRREAAEGQAEARREGGSSGTDISPAVVLDAEKQSNPAAATDAEKRDHVKYLHAYESFLSDAARVRHCGVCFNWLKLHAWLAAAVFHEEGLCSSFSSGIDCMRSTPLYAIDISAFTFHLDKQLRQLPLRVVQAADAYLLQCVECFREFLRQQIYMQLLLLQRGRASTAVTAAATDTAAADLLPEKAAGAAEEATTASAAAATAASGRRGGHSGSTAEKVEAAVNRLLVHAAARVPMVGYALVKSTLSQLAPGAAAAEWDLLLLQHQQRRSKTTQLLPRLSKQQLLRACLDGFPELRIPAAAADIWSLEVASTLLLTPQSPTGSSSSTRSSSGRCTPADSSSSSSGAVGEAMEKGRIASAREAASGSGETSSAAAGAMATTVAELRRPLTKSWRGQELWKQLVVKQQQQQKDSSSSMGSSSGPIGGGNSMAVFLSVLKGRCFFAEGLLLLLPEEELPQDTRDRLATLFMCKSPWWIEEVHALLLPSLMGKEMIGTIAGPPKRFCSTRQVLLTACTRRTKKQQQSDTGEEAAERRQQQQRVTSDRQQQTFFMRVNEKKKKNERVLQTLSKEIYTISDDSEEYGEDVDNEGEEEVDEDDVDVAVYSHNLPLRYWPVDVSI